MNQAAKAGSVYFVAAFGLGFLLGTVRVLVLEPRVGSLAATLIELPIMLLASWYICRWVASKFRVPSSLDARVTMGALAFVLLLTAETLLGILAFDQTLSQQLSGYGDAARMLGLVGQILFAAFPAIQAQSDSG